MAIFGVVRVGFQTNANANNKARYALTGTITAGDPEMPFRLRNTGVFTVEGADNAAVAASLAKLSKVLVQESDTIDIVSINLTRTDAAVAPDVVPPEAAQEIKQAVDG